MRGFALASSAGGRVDFNKRGCCAESRKSIVVGKNMLVCFLLADVAGRKRKLLLVMVIKNDRLYVVGIIVLIFL